MSAFTAMNCFGTDLSPKDYAALEARWITPFLAEGSMIRRVDSLSGREIVGRKNGNCAGLLIPFVHPVSKQITEYCLRRDEPDLEIRNGKTRETGKYIMPPGARNRIYFPPDVAPEMLTAPDIPVIVTEGQFKTLALWRLAIHGQDAPRFLPLGLSGVSNWRGVIGKATGPTGGRRDVKGVISDFDLMQLKDRKVIIAFDADAKENENVRIARAGLAKELRSRGASVDFLEWDIAKGKGIDDHLAAVGPEAVLGEISGLDFTRRDWRANLMSNRDGEPRALLANAITALREAPDWAGCLAFNEFSFNTVALTAPPWGDCPLPLWSDHADILTTDWLQRHGISISVKVAAEAVEAVARDRSFHPVKQYLDGLEWDGTSRIDGWLSLYLGATPSDYTSAVGARWLISAVARIYQPGCKADCCLILEGAQGIKKSTSIRTLAGEWFTDEIAELGSKDAAMQSAGVWLVELAELDSMNRSEVSKIKAFMSRSTDRFRLPYGRRVIEAPRHSIFAGSVNNSTYLRDETGGRRFWPVACTRILIDELGRDRDQLWAEAVHRFNAGEVWWLDSAELNRAADAEQAERYDGDAWDGVIREWLVGRESVSIDEVLTNCIDKPRAQWSQADKVRVSRSLTASGWSRYKSGPRNQREWRYKPMGDPRG